MYKISTLKNGLTLITVDLPHLDSITTMLAIGAGSRYETKKNNGISHFLEHMFFKGSKKYPSAEIIQTTLDGIGAINNAATSKEFTFYYVKSSSEKVELASGILSSMLSEPLLKEEEIQKEKGAIAEEIRMIKDNPARHVWDLYEKLQFGDQPLGWDIIGDEKTLNAFTRVNFVEYINSLYSPNNMVLIYVGKLPKNIKGMAEKYFAKLTRRDANKVEFYRKQKQVKSRVNITYKKSDQAHIVLGMEGFSRNDPNRYTAKVIGTILGEGMSSRLFLQVREKRGLAYHIEAGHETYKDTGIFVIGGGLKLEKLEEALKVILLELKKLVSEKVMEDELKKAKEMIRGRLAIRSESTNFLAELFGIEFVLDRKLETFEEYLKKIDAVTAEDILSVAKNLFKKEKFNLQMICPLKSTTPFEKILNS